ncbi:Uncharacterised protein [Serratia rubidaea]|uniref:Uncharacterized protein n=1 Tax=Serratia rubidaea TaxID=61652 RepID=A0A447QVX0_SERRU|nr:Uncharacterised protein [Serratia rubidaea]
MAGAEVINRQHNAQIFQRANMFVLNLRQRGTFGQLQHQRRHRIGRQPDTADIGQDRLRVEMLGGDVDADIKRRARRKQRQIFHHRGHQKAGQGVNQTVLLGQRDKHVRRDPALPLAVPAQQDFDAETAAAGAVDDRLTVDLEFAAVNGMADMVRQAHAVGGNQIDHIGGQQADQQRQRHMGGQRLKRHTLG